MRNVEHLLRNSPVSLQAPAPRHDTIDASGTAAGAYAPDFERSLLELTMMPQPHAVFPPVASAASPFHFISPTSAGTELVEKINANNQSFDARLAAVWEALGRQQIAYTTFKEDTRRELQDLRRSLSAAHSDTHSATHERDGLRYGGQAQEAEIQRLRSEVLALQARLADVRSPSPIPQFPDPMAPPADCSGAPPGEVSAEVTPEFLPEAPAEPPAESPAEPPADSLSEPLAEPLADSLADSLAEPLADSLAEELNDFLGEAVPEARGRQPEQTPEQPADAQPGQPLQPTQAPLSTLEPPRDGQAAHIHADGLSEQKEQLASALDGTSGRSPAHGDLGAAGTPGMPTAHPSASPPPGISAGMQALSQYESSSEGSRSTCTSRSGSPERVLGRSLRDGLGPSEKRGELTVGSVEGPETEPGELLE